MSGAIHTQFIKFGMVGISGMALDFSVTWLCKEKLRLNKYISNSAGFCFAVVSNFLLNRLWTFESIQEPAANQFVYFTLVSATGLLINNLFLYLLLKYAKKNFYFLKLVVTGLVFFWNYFMNLLFTFNQP